MALSWYDPRLSFQNLKESSSRNTMNFEERDSIWIPDLVFHNTADKETTREDEKAIFSVARREPNTFVPKPLQERHNGHYYKGKHSLINTNRVYYQV